MKLDTSQRHAVGLFRCSFPGAVARDVGTWSRTQAFTTSACSLRRSNSWFGADGIWAHEPPTWGRSPVARLIIKPSKHVNTLTHACVCVCVCVRERDRERERDRDRDRDSLEAKHHRKKIL